MELRKRLRYRRHNFTLEERKLLAKLYDDGFSAESIAHKAGCSAGFVYSSHRLYGTAKKESKPDFLASLMQQEETQPEQEIAKPAVKREPVAKQPTNEVPVKKEQAARNSKKLPQETIDAIFELQAQGLTQSKIAEQLHIHSNTVNRHIQDGRAKAHNKKLIVSPVKAIRDAEDIKAEVVRLHDDNYYSSSTIALELGIPIEQVVEIIKEHKFAQ